MQEATRRSVERWWSTVLGVAAVDLWRTVTVAPHHAASPLRDHGGWWVVWHAGGVHVSLPPGAEPPSAEDLAAGSDPATWRRVAEERRLRVVGPSVHAYLDRDPLAPTAATVPVERVGAEAVSRLRRRVGAGEWQESGFGDLDPAADVCFAVRRGREVVAAANLTPYDGAPRDVGVLVSPGHRGLGLGRVVGRHAASFAVREHGLARWRARVGHHRSLAVAEHLGFEPVCTQLSLRR